MVSRLVIIPVIIVALIATFGVARAFEQSTASGRTEPWAIEKFFGLDMSHELDSVQKVVLPEPRDFSQFPLKIHAEVNKERAKAGLSPLAYHEGMASVAEAHSKDMATRKFFDHVNPDGLDPFDRADRANQCTTGENLIEFSATLYSDEELPAKVVGGWMNSQGHRENILEPVFQAEGIGLAVDTDDAMVYVTELFC